ncbi:hypothetical protein PVL29_007675 [Vitis rotundifolia]|uniref:RING-type E3 ubiquitin transferase n=1 Tax=Vitis rotundifolia TaxID=103349 RepID=A0AA39A0X6_VITRO|nr:hypothetical protein PVL29_007675 [Vitis rotundifolia]
MPIYASSSPIISISLLYRQLIQTNFPSKLSPMASQDPRAFHWYLTDDHKGFRFHSRVLLLSIIFFIFILLVNFLFLYGQWLCRRRSAAHSDLVSRSQSYAARTLQPADCHGLEAAIIDSFPIFFYGSLGDSNAFKDVVKESECSICLGVFQKKEKIKMLPRCHHAYHAECVDKWLRAQSSCPLCRASLLVDPLDESAIP